MSPPENLAVAMAWFRRDQWVLLRAVSADADKLEQTYDEWLTFASGQLRELEARGLRVQKIDVEVGRSRAGVKARGGLWTGRRERYML